MTNPSMPRTGFPTLDEARRPRKAVTGIQMLPDPTDAPSSTFRTGSGWGGWAGAAGCWGFGQKSTAVSFDDIDEAYRVDSYVRQGIDKYVELITKHGWWLDCETPEPVAYVKSRLLLMALMTDKPWEILLHETVCDFVKYGNAFWVKYRGTLQEPYPGLPTKGAGVHPLPVLGYYRVDPKRMQPAFSKDGKRRVGWEYTRPDGTRKVYYRGDVIHFAYNRQAGELLGSPHLQPVLEDIRAYRQCEEYVLRLLHKHLTPLMHHEVPDRTNGHGGRQEDVDAAWASHSTIAPDGMIITPPGHKITMVGAESRALRGEGYMALLKSRVFAGLGVSQLVMGEGETTAAGSADALTMSMHNKAKFFQKQLGALLTHFVLYELLLEGDFSPTNPQDVVEWMWEEIEIEAQIAKENHEIQKYHGNLTTEDESRRSLKKKPLSDEEYDRTHVNRVQIHLSDAQAEAKAEGAAALAKSKANPSNQHGKRGAPKVRR